VQNTNFWVVKFVVSNSYECYIIIEDIIDLAAVSQSHVNKQNGEIQS